MVSFLEEFGIDESDVVEPTGFDVKPKDDTYEFTISKAYVDDGSKANPGNKAVRIYYDLGEVEYSNGKVGHYEAMEYFLVKENGQVTEKVLEKMGWLKRRLSDFGLELASFDPEALVGRTGAVTLKTKNNYQNVSKVVAEPDDGSGGWSKEEEAKPRKASAKPAAPEASENPFG
jgi:hypothetical protein